MVIDFDIYDFYRLFKVQAKKDLDKYTKEVKYYIETKNKYKAEIIELIDFYKETYNVDINNYVEFTDEKYNDKESLFNKFMFIATKEDNEDNRVNIYKIIKYAIAIRKIDKYNNLIRLATKRSSISCRKYQNYISRYYSEVHRNLLLGAAYKFNYGIGYYAISRYILNNKNKVLDYVATKKNKEKLLKEGKRLYNKHEAAWYKYRGLDYDGVDYRIYRKEDYYYCINIFKSKLFSFHSKLFKQSDYINKRHRSKSIKDIANECKNLDDIANYPMSLNRKLLVYLYKNPHKKIIFDRGDDETIKRRN